MGVVKFILSLYTENMKVFCLVLSSLLATTLAEVTCDDCTAATGALIDRLLSEDSIAEQVTIVGATVCPSMPDPAACEEYLTTWWGAAAECVFNAIADTNPCGTLGYCKKEANPLVKDWTCDECTDVLARVAAFLQEAETIDMAIGVLQGDCFCGMDGHSADSVAGLIPAAMPVLAGVLTEQTTELCQDLVGV